MHAHFHVRTVVVSVLLASMCAASPPGGGRESAEHVQPSVSKAIPEVAKLFQRGKEPFVSDAMKALLVACVTELDAEQRFDNQSEKFYRCVERLRRYLDTHRILASDIESFRVEMASECVIRDSGTIEPGVARAKPLAIQVRDLYAAIWDMASDSYEECEPRHALLFAMLSPMEYGYPRLDVCVFHIRRATANGPLKETDAIQTFLLQKDGGAVARAVVDDMTAIVKANNAPEYGECGDEAQACLESRDNSTAFKGHLGTFVNRYEKALKGFPDYAICEKWILVRYVRGMWNTVHAYGTREAKTELKECLTELRSYYAERGDLLAAKWLDEVMLPPGEPPKAFVETVTLAPIKPVEKK